MKRSGLAGGDRPAGDGGVSQSHDLHILEFRLSDIKCHMTRLRPTLRDIRQSDKARRNSLDRPSRSLAAVADAIGSVWEVDGEFKLERNGLGRLRSHLNDFCARTFFAELFRAGYGRC